MPVIWKRVSITLLVLLVLWTPAVAGRNSDHVAGIGYKYVDSGGRFVTMTSRLPEVGDEIIKAGGLHYRVTKVRDNTAVVELVGRDEEYLSLVDYYAGLGAVPAASREWSRRPVGIYHTHTAESYLPTDGAPSIPFKGGIYQVGEAFGDKLREQRVRVLYDRTPHDPHDANAYHRSRRTAAKLLQKNPAALFDIHRDGVHNPDFYRNTVADQNIAQMRLVVGRQNPKMEANLDFAKRLLAYARKEHPGLLKEIYIARGNYNQDLLSTALLIEAGTYTNEKWQAINGITLLAEAVPVVLGLEPPAPGETRAGGGRQGWKTALFLILLLITAFTGFIIINIPGFNAREYLQKKYALYRLRLGKLAREIKRRRVK